ncbi:MAG: TlpA family protein disulfide reductase [Acidobacteriaceae bacterium]|nr:TlpA family protein disulfide reductase [Acidobacteriaceae bacterium]
MTVDSARGRWRERSISGTGDRIKLFDGQNLYEFEDGDSDYVRSKLSPKGVVPEPDPYGSADLDMSKAIERNRTPCGLSTVDHQCVTLEVPVKSWIRNGSSGMSRMLGGSRLLVFDTVTGLLISTRTLESIEDQRGIYQSDVSYMLKRMSYNGAVDEALFSLPPGATNQVQQLPPWNAERIKKRLAGKTAPDLALTDIQGKSFKLSDLKGKTVLLDFWATWCGPCRADGPSLDKLYQKYSDRNLAVIGISVDEERPVVQKFLGEHPHKYPIVLTTENEMPRAYQIGVFPTYVVIDPDGNVASATEGDKGFSELRRLLKKAGLETD